MKSKRKETAFGGDQYEAERSVYCLLLHYIEDSVTPLNP